jgi:proteasome activator subunit 4
LIKAKTFEDDYLDTILSGIEPLITDSDRFKQRACAEVLLGLLRGKVVVSSTIRSLRVLLGSKHWPKQKWEKLWSWTLQRMDTIFAQIKPDTIQFWESVFMVSVFVSCS